MKRTLCTAIIAALFVIATPLAAQERAPHAQQDKFSQCAHESKGLKGEEHNKFMSECLKGHDTRPGEKAKPAVDRPVKEARNDDDPPREGQQGRMKACNDEAGRRSLHGDERRAFMSACLKSRD
jgi:hypothetical protein